MDIPGRRATMPVEKLASTGEVEVKRKVYSLRGHRIAPPDMARLDKELALECGRCGGRSAYRVGTVLLDLERASSRGAMESVGFTGYFRCHFCQGGGPWRLTPPAMLAILDLVRRRKEGETDLPLACGKLELFDGTRIRYATEGETYLKGLIGRSPRDAFLWSRLGNLYRSGERDDLARDAYERAIELDPYEVDSHHSLASILMKQGDTAGSVGHFHKVLEHAGKHQGEIDSDLLRALVRNSIECLFEIAEETDEDIDILPALEAEEAPRPREGGSDEAVLQLRTLDLSTEEDREELVSLYLRTRWTSRRDRRPPAATGPRWFRQSRLKSKSAVRTLGPTRNGPCPCGSGSKYKNCCSR